MQCVMHNRFDTCDLFLAGRADQGTYAGAAGVLCRSQIQAAKAAVDLAQHQAKIEAAEAALKDHAQVGQAACKQPAVLCAHWQFESARCPSTFGWFAGVRQPLRHLGAL